MRHAEISLRRQVMERQRLLDAARARAARNAVIARNTRQKVRRRAERIALLEDVIRSYLDGQADRSDLMQIVGDHPRAHAQMGGRNPV